MIHGNRVGLEPQAFKPALASVMGVFGTLMTRLAQAFGQGPPATGPSRNNDGPASDRGSATLSMAIIALAAKLSKADGVSAPIEQETFERVFKIANADLGRVRGLYDLARRSRASLPCWAMSSTG